MTERSAGKGKTHSPDPSRLDVEAFARDADHLEGSTPLARFGRLLDSLHADARAAAAADGVVHWSAQGERRVPRGAPPQSWLHLEAAATLALECQRCLEPVETEVRAERDFRFATDEARAAEEDADAEEDVLVLSRAFDLLALVEDELLLALPLVPRHAECPSPLPLAEQPDAAQDEPANPFAALAALKRNPSLPN